MTNLLNSVSVITVQPLSANCSVAMFRTHSTSPYLIHSSIRTLPHLFAGIPRAQNFRSTSNPPLPPLSSIPFSPLPFLPKCLLHSHPFPLHPPPISPSRYPLSPLLSALYRPLKSPHFLHLHPSFITPARFSPVRSPPFVVHRMQNHASQQGDPPKVKRTCRKRKSKVMMTLCEHAYV